MNAESGDIWKQAAKLRGWDDATAVPWWGVARVTRSSTRARVAGNQRVIHRGCSPPWLWPRTSICRPPAIADMRRTALTTYSACTWMSPVLRFGRVTVQTSKPLARNWGR